MVVNTVKYCIRKLTSNNYHLGGGGGLHCTSELSNYSEAKSEGHQWLNYNIVLGLVPRDNRQQISHSYF
jgi:hypothetical protein